MILSIGNQVILLTDLVPYRYTYWRFILLDYIITNSYGANVYREQCIWRDIISYKCNTRPTGFYPAMMLERGQPMVRVASMVLLSKSDFVKQLEQFT